MDHAARHGASGERRIAANHLVALTCGARHSDAPRLQKPDKALRYSPLVKVIPATLQLQRVLMLHPDPIRHDKERKYCFCKSNGNSEMVLCDECLEWYHRTCVGTDEEQASGSDDWRCGYCVGEPDADGNRHWELDIPQNGRKKKRTAPDRNDDEAPKALGTHLRRM